MISYDCYVVIMSLLFPFRCHLDHVTNTLALLIVGPSLTPRGRALWLMFTLAQGAPYSMQNLGQIKEFAKRRSGVVSVSVR